MMTSGLAIHAATPARTDARSASAGWDPLYKVGGWAAIAMLAIMPVQMIVFFIWPLPTSVLDWFALFQSNPIAGLVDMDILLLVDWVLTILIFMALGVAMRHADRALLALAMTFELLGTAAYFASTGAFEMLSLSQRYTTAASSDERASALAAGQTVLASWQGTAFVAAGVLGAIAILLLSAAALRSGSFGRAVPWLGLAMGVFAIVPPNAGTIGLVSSLLYLAPFVAWLVLVARALLHTSEVRLADRQS